MFCRVICEIRAPKCLFRTAFSGQYRLKKHSLKTNFNCIKWLNEISITHPDMPRQTPLRTNGYVQTERTAAERVSHTGLQRVSKIWLLLSWRLPATVGPTLNPQSRKNAFAGKAPAAFGVLREEQRAYPPAAAFAFGVPQEQKRGCYPPGAEAGTMSPKNKYGDAIP